MASTCRPPPAGFGTPGDPPPSGGVMIDDPLTVSPYLLRPLRSYAEALRDRDAYRALWAPQDALPGETDPSAAPATNGIGDPPRPARRSTGRGSSGFRKIE